MFLMVTLVASLGTSPMVVTETIDELKKRGITVDRVVVLVTKDPRVETSYYALALDFMWNYENVELKRVELPFDDIKSQKDHDEFVRIAKEVIKGEIENGRDVVVSVAGGRKTMGVGLYKAGLEVGVEEFYHVIAEEVAGASDFLKNLMMHDLKSIYEGKAEAPESLKNLISWEMHRPDLTIHLIKI